MENNKNQEEVKEEVVKTEEEKRQFRRGLAILAGTGVTAYMLGKRRGIKQGIAAGHAFAMYEMVEALTTYSEDIVKHVTSKGD